MFVPSLVPAMRRLALGAGLVAALVGTASADMAPSRPRPLPDDDPERSAAGTRCQTLLKAQLGTLAHEDAFAATFAKDAMVMTPTGVHKMPADTGAGEAIAFLNSNAEIKDATFNNVMFGGNAKVSWCSAELHLTVAFHEPGSAPTVEKHTVRAIELLDGSAGWKVAVAAFTNVAKLSTSGSGAIIAPTEPGLLTNLLLTPGALANALGGGAVVFGTDPGERALGTEPARKLLKKWKALTITLDPESKPREVHGRTFGYAMANVRLTTKPGGPAYKLNAFLLALPGPEGTWAVIGASYGAMF